MMPLSFGLHDQNQPYTLHIQEQMGRGECIFDMRNLSDAPLVFDPLTAPVDDNAYHLALNFPPGTLATDNIPAIALSPGSEQHWRLSNHQTAPGAAITLFFQRITPSENLVPGASIHIGLLGIYADGGTEQAPKGTREVTLEISTRHMHAGAGKQPQHHTVALPLQLINHRGLPYIPLHLGFGHSNTLLNDGNPSRLTLTLTNTMTPGDAIPFTYDTQEASNTSAITLFFNASPHPVDWALASKKDEQNIRVTAPPGWLTEALPANATQPPRWRLQPAENQQTLAAGEQLDIAINHIITDYPAGSSRLYVHYQNIPGYADGQLTTYVQKQPLVYRDHNIGMGTDTPDEKLHIRGSSPKIKLSNTQETDSGIVFTDAQAEARQRFEILFNAKDEHLHIRADDNNGRDIMTLKHSGRVGIGTDNPTAKLEIDGDIKIQGSITLGGHKLTPAQWQKLCELVK